MLQQFIMLKFSSFGTKTFTMTIIRFYSKFSIIQNYTNKFPSLQKGRSLQWLDKHSLIYSNAKSHSFLSHQDHNIIMPIFYIFASVYYLGYLLKVNN